MISIDIAAGHVSCGIFKKRGHGKILLQQLAMERFEAEAGVENAWSEKAGEALGRVAAKMKLTGSVALSIPDRVALTKFIKVPSVASKKRARVIEFEAGQAIPFPLSEVVWDYRVVGDDGKELEVMLTVAKRAIVESLCASMTTAGFSVVRIVPASHALRDAVVRKGGRTTESVLVIDFQPASITLVYAGPEIFRLRVIGEAGSEIERLHQEIGRFLAHALRETGAAMPSRVYVTGDRSALPGFELGLAEKLKVPVQPLDFLQDFDFAMAGEPADRGGVWNMIPPLAGLARGENAAYGLLPTVVRKDVGFRRRQPVLLATAALLVLALVPPLIYFRSAARTANGRATEIEASVVPLRAMARINAANLAKIKTTDSRIGETRRLCEAKAAWVEFLADLQDRMDDEEDVWLEQMQVKRPTTLMSAKAATKPDLQFLVSGRLLDMENPDAKVSAESYAKVRRFFSSLADSPFVSALRDERFDNSQPGLLRFDVTLVLKPERLL